MLTKILIFLAVVIGVFIVARMGAASALKPAKARKGRKSRAKESPVEDLRLCRTCGKYVARDEYCGCEEAPTP